MRNNKLAATSGGGFMKLFGILFYFPIIDMGLRYSRGDLRSPWELLFGLLFATVATGMVFGRSGREIDRERHTLTSWWGLSFWRFGQQTFELAEFDEVQVSKETRGGGDSQYTVYAVHLLGTGEKLEWDAPTDYLEARKQSEQLSEFLKIPLQDNHTGHRRDSDELNVPLGKRLRAQGEPPEIGPKPAESMIVHRSENNREVFELPVTVEWLDLVFWMAVSIWLVSAEVDESFAPFASAARLDLVLPLLVLITAVVVLFRVRRFFRARWVVSVSPEGFNYEEKSKPGSRICIPLAELEELDLVDDGKAWEVRSDHHVFRSNSRLKRPEVAWMKNALEHYIYKFS